MKNRSLHLSLLMFFIYGAIGTYVPIIILYLTDYLGFSSIQAGVILSLSSIPSILAPFLSAFIVDRLISSRKMLALCTLFTAVLILVLSFERNYMLVLITYFIYMIFLVPSLSLVHSLTFHFIDNRDKYPFIRSWATVGWIVTGCIISVIWNITDSIETLPFALQLSAIISIAVILLTLKLPVIELEKKEKLTLIPYETVEVLKKPEVYFILLIVFLSSTIDKFISYGTPIFLNINGVAQKDMLVILSIGQIPEIIFLFVLTPIIRKMGIKRVMITAFIFQMLRFMIFYINGHLYLTIFGTVFQGMIYPLFYAPATIYLDKFTTAASRSGVHQIYNLIFAGLAGLVGNFLAGLLAQSYTVDGGINFKVFWMLPGLATVLTFVMLLLYLKRYKITFE